MPFTAARSSTVILMLFAILLLHSTEGRAQGRPQPWNAHWIGYPGSTGTDYEVLFFRRDVTLEALPDSFPVHVSADNRYRLFVNGTSVATGPARGDLAYWRYETVDLAPHLKTGSNVVSAVVWNYAALRPVAQVTHRTGFILQGASPEATVLNTSANWHVLRSAAHAAIPVNRAALDYTYIVVGPGELVDGRRFPWGWDTDSDALHTRDRWVAAEPIGAGHPRGSAPYGAAVSWQLVPRDIPMMEETPVRLERIARIDEAPSPFSATEGFLRGEEDLVLPPNRRLVLILDHGALTTGYPVLRTSGGRDARLELTYAEALFAADGSKGHRDELSGKEMRGIRDAFVLDGGEERTYSTLWWRTWRFMELRVETAGDTLRLHDLHGVFTAYPFQERGGFAADDPELSNIWDVGWRTARLCAGETYFDCPYYEQIQYVGDTRIQALISLYVSGDDRLMRRAITDFDHSRVASGLTASRYPVYEQQFIPPYSLFWVVMVHDYWMHREDSAFVAARLNGIRGVLDWFESHIDETGLLGPMPWWNFVDWAYERSGVPPGADDGHSTVIALQYVYALERAAELSRGFGRSEEADNYVARAARLKDVIRQWTWDPRRGFFADTPQKTFFSEHTNAMAVLVGLVPPQDQSRFMDRLLKADDLLEAGFYYRFYVHRALKEAGLGDRYVSQLQPWREMLALGLTTFAENPGRTRSDCHAWSAAPNYDFLSLVAGVVPDAPGFRRVHIAPALGSLRRIRAVVAHPHGEIVVELARETNGISGVITLPEEITGRFEWQGREIPLHPGAQNIRF